MGLFFKFFLCSGILSAVMFTLMVQKSPPLPQIVDEWWGEGALPETEDKSIKPFEINISDEILVDLNKRLNRSDRTVAALDGVGFHYGFNSQFIETIRDFWSNSYSWKKEEAYLNSFPQFKTNVAGLDIHFIHVQPANTTKRVLPLLLVHGWPGSFVEFLKIIPMLTEESENEEFVFEIIAPSLPGYGFSQATRKPGMGAIQLALVFDKLMTRLGFNNYYVQGGDWGSIIGTHMATLYPHRITGLHVNMVPMVASGTANLKLILGSLWPSMLMPSDKVHLVYPLLPKYAYILQETGYAHLQATKPDTIGMALSDSPIGLAAYILEKFATWTDKSKMDQDNGGLLDKFTMTELLNNVMIYWVTNSMTSAMRLYSETMNIRTMQTKLDEIVCTVPTGVANFPEELFLQPKSIVEHKFGNLMSYNFMERGGHFGAFEEPRLLATDVRNFVQMVENL